MKKLPAPTTPLAAAVAATIRQQRHRYATPAPTGSWRLEPGQPIDYTKPRPTR